MSIGTAEIVICRDEADMHERAADAFLDRAEACLSRKGMFTVALSGGRTPKGLYERISMPGKKELLDWRRIHIFWGDERGVPPEHDDSNYRMVLEPLLRKLRIPKGNVHRIKGEKGDNAAAEYEKEMIGFFGTSGNAVPVFDLILLGMGSDGHTASLFPGMLIVADDGSVKIPGSGAGLAAAVRVGDAGRLRITLTPVVINSAREIFFLVSGREKAAALSEVLEGRFDPERFPAQLVRRAKGKVTWFVDKEAASGLGSSDYGGYER